MHELAIARALVDLVRRRTAPGDEVTEVAVDLGALTGVIPDCLSFHFQGVVRGGSLEGACLRCRLVSARIRCGACGVVYQPEGQARVCAACGALGGVVVNGNELDVVRIVRRRERQGESHDGRDLRV